MRVHLLVGFLLVFACESANRREEPPTPPTPMRPLDASIARCTVLRDEPLDSEAMQVSDVAWRSPTEVLVSVRDRDAKATAKHGLAVYDISKPGLTANATYHLDAVRFAIVGPTVFAIGFDRISSVELATMCMLQSDRLEIEHAAIDTKRGRVFVVTRTALLRLDGSGLRVALDVAAPKQIAKLGYDPTSDRLIVRTYDNKVELYDGGTLKPAGTFPLADITRGGPWVRPDVAEVWFSYDVFCKKRKYDGMPGPPRMSLGPCMDDPKTVGSFLTRYELPTGKLLETIHYTGGEATFSEGGASFSGDGKQLIVTSVSHAHLQTIGGKSTFLRQLRDKPKPEYEWGPESFPAPMALDTDGKRFAAGFYGYHFRIGDTVTGTTLWEARLPGINPY